MSEFCGKHFLLVINFEGSILGDSEKRIVVVYHLLQIPEISVKL